jgi:hypothetical protein
MDDEELAESVAKRKQAEAHGYVAPTINQKKGLGELPLEAEGGDDEDDFFSLKRKVANGEDEDVDVPAPAPGGGGEGKKSKSKRKAEGEREFLFILSKHQPYKTTIHPCSGLGRD